MQPNSDTVLFVASTGAEAQRRVDSSSIFCCCVDADMQQMPCRHLMRVMQHVREEERLINIVHSSYLVSTHSQAFESRGVELPLKDAMQPTSEILPFSFFKRRGKPRTNRIRSAGDDLCGKTSRSRRKRHVDERELSSQHVDHAVELSSSSSSEEDVEDVDDCMAVSFLLS